MVKNISYMKINIINPLYPIIDKIKVHIEESNWNKYLILVPINGSNKILKIYVMWSETRDLISSIINKSDGYHKKYMKTKLSLDDDLPLNKALEHGTSCYICFTWRQKILPARFLRWVFT